MLLFDLTVSEHREHPDYRNLRCSPFHNEAKQLMSDLYTRMGDPNGGFVGDFQSDGFHGRLFELASFAYLEEAGAIIDRRHERPDFMVDFPDCKLAFEVTTVNPSSGKDRGISVARIKPLRADELDYNVSVEFPSRIIAAIRKKVRKGYPKLDHCRGRALVLAIAPYHEAGSVFYVDESLLGHLYGCSVPGQSHVPQQPIFTLPESASISAVLFCNQFTVSRFLRIAHRDRADRPLFGVRQGFCLQDDFACRSYKHRLDDDSIPRETWSEGVTIFHNPSALFPLPLGLLPSTSYFHLVNECLIREITGFHPLLSMMFFQNQMG